MEINITKYVKNPPPAPVYGSVAQYGKDAGEYTFGNAKAAAAGCDLLDTTEKADAFKSYAEGFGAWEREELDRWTHDELVALFIQFIAADISENGDIDERDEDAEGCETFKGVDGEYYYECYAY